MRARISLFFLALTAVLSIATLYPQSPAPVIVQAAPTAPKVVQVPAVGDATAANLKMLRELKAANEETLKKQEAALQTLDELQKAADQIKLYTKRS
jgi:hypothetical protein